MRKVGLIWHPCELPGLFVVGLCFACMSIAGCHSSQTESPRGGDSARSAATRRPGDSDSNSGGGTSVAANSTAGAGRGNDANGQGPGKRKEGGSSGEREGVALDPPRLDSPWDGPVWFTEVTASTGIAFRHVSGDSPKKPFPAANGSGVAAFDFDLDGSYDVYFATGRPFPLDLSRPDPRNRLYRSRGDLQFEDVTDQAGVGFNGYCAGLAVGDFDADGFPDVYLNCFGPNAFYRNLGDGTFERAESAAGVIDERWGTSAAWFDYDTDGLLDLYVCNYAKWTWETNPYCGDEMRRLRMYCGPRSVEPVTDVLYHNAGDGTFRDAGREAGATLRDARGQGVVAGDVNGDGHIDVYVGNDLHANFLLLGNGDGTFRDATESSGAAYDGAGTPQAGMGVDIGDVNRDGLFDLIVTNFAQDFNTLYENLGQDFFLDSSGKYGLVADSLPFVGWGTQILDFNLDGWPDIVITNGHIDNNRHLITEDSSYKEYPLLYRNDRGQRFTRLKGEAGEYFLHGHVGRGLASVDLDNDGDHDIVIVQQDDLPAVLRNDRLGPTPRADAASVTLRLVGTQSNRDAIGASLAFQSPLGTLRQLVKGGGSYLSAPDLRQVFAVPTDAAPGSLQCTIRWPNGGESVVKDLRPGQRWLVLEPTQGDHPPRLFPLPE